MEKLVIVHEFDNGDAWVEKVVPIMYESKEAFAAAFTAECNRGIAIALKEERSYVTGAFTVGKLSIELHEYTELNSAGITTWVKHALAFKSSLPEIYTLDEWFEQNK